MSDVEGNLGKEYESLNIFTGATDACEAWWSFDGSQGVKAC